MLSPEERQNDFQLIFSSESFFWSSNWKILSGDSIGLWQETFLEVEKKDEWFIDTLPDPLTQCTVIIFHSAPPHV